MPFRNFAGRTALLAGPLFAVCLALGGPARAERIFVSNEKDNTIAVVDGKTLNLVKTVTVGARPRGIVLSNDAKTLYICTSDADHIEALDLASLTVTRTLPSGPDPELFTLSPDGKLLYVANENDNMVSVLDIAESRIVTEIPVGLEPEGMGVTPPKPPTWRISSTPRRIR
jgi:YVTN family beta-propeller protein